MEDIYRNENYRQRNYHSISRSGNRKYQSNNRKKGKKRKPKRMKKNKLNKKKVFLVIAIFVTIIFAITHKDKKIETSGKETQEQENKTEKDTTSTMSNTEPTNTQTTSKVEITDWRLRLANYDNLLPEDFEVELANIDSTRQFDARAIKDLNNMINAMKKSGNTKIWCQSTYRSVKRQKELFDESVQKYLKQGKSEEEAEKLTLEYINKPGGSDHNLGLAVDFNYVDNSFAKTSEYKWLLKNAENYGFILRYPEDKEDKTKIAYESWHWRYVGEEHAKRMNELNMCLEEYVEYLQDGNK